MPKKYFNTIGTAIYNRQFSDCNEIIQRYTSTKFVPEYTIAGRTFEQEYYRQIDNLEEVKEVTLTEREAKILNDIINKNKLINRKGGGNIQFNFIKHAEGRNKGEAPLLLRRIISPSSFSVSQAHLSNCFSACWDYISDERYMRAFEVLKSRDDWFYVKIQRESHKFSPGWSYACDGFFGLVKLIEQEIDDYLKEKK